MLDPVSEKHYLNPVAGFTKLFSSLIFSTVWREEMHVKVVWITMLAMANRNGEVLSSIPGLADAARVSRPQCDDALAKLSSPDPDSRTKDFEGRRILEVDGGWRLLNYPKYREIRDADERRIQTREAVRRHREKAKEITVSNVSPRKPRKAQAEAEAEAEAENITTTARARVISALGDSPDLVAVCKMAGNPEALCMEIMALLDGMHGTPPKVEAVRMALRDMAITGNRPSGKMLRAFVRKAGEPDATTGGGYTGYQEYKP